MIQTNTRHPAQCLTGLFSLRNDGKLCDVVIEAEGTQFCAHRAVLASCSPYFMAMFTGTLEESKKRVVTIHEISAPIMEAILSYCYTAAIEVTADNVQFLLPAACILQLGWIRDICCEFMKRNLCSTNCLGVKAFADTHACVDLCKAADSFVQQHYLEVLEGEEFLELEVDLLEELLQSEELNVRCEEQVFESVMRWVKHDVDNRKQHLPCVLEHVRLPLLERNYLVSKVGTEPLIRQNEACRDLLDEAKDYLLVPEQRARLSGPRTRPRRPLKSQEVLFAVGGWCNGDAISMVERYDIHSNEWQVVSNMNKRRCGVGIAIHNNFLYAIGGHDGNSYLNSVERYDPVTDHWSSNLTPTSTCRTSVGVGVLNDQIYAIGGQDGSSCLNVVECYSLSCGGWSSTCSMNTQRLGVGIGVMGNCLYAVGGSDGSSPLNTVERYDPRTNRWTFIAPMQIKRKHLGVAVMDNMLYAVGGRDDKFELSSVERYEPRMNCWSSVVAMNERRSGLGLCVVSNRLYAVGGFNGGVYLKSMEWLDEMTNEWQPTASMNYRRLGCGVGVLNLPS